MYDAKPTIVKASALLKDKTSSLNERIARYNNLAAQIKDRYQSEDRITPLTRLINIIQNDYPDIVNRQIDLSNDELALIFLIRSLNIELQNCLEEAVLFKPAALPARHSDVVSHFGMADSEAMQQHWVEVYSRLLKKGWLRSNETESGDWVYVCCGKGVAPVKPLVWHGSNAALAYIVRNKFLGNWDVAHSVFVTKNGSPLPKSFSKTNPPTDNVCTCIDLMFKKH